MKAKCASRVINIVIYTTYESRLSSPDTDAEASARPDRCGYRFSISFAAL